MRRRLLAVLLGGALLPAGLTGCGIPADSDVQVDGHGPVAEEGSSNGGGTQPPNPKASSDPKEFIRNYLRAAAGEREQAYDRVKKFIADQAQSRLPKKQSSEIALTVVRLREDPEAKQNNDGTSVVTIRVQQVGVLRADGTLAPPVARETQYQFTLRPAETGGLLITDLPNVLLLSDDALQKFYVEHTIYFWNSEQSQLVPDQRYLPSAVPAERRVTDVVKWLAGGPSDWLASGVTRLPDGTAPINNATGSDGRWEINLAMPGANEARLARLATQLAWSLPELTGQLDLKIQNQSRRTIDLNRERLDHPVYATTGSPQRYCVYDGGIHPLSFPGEASGPVPLAAAANKGVVSAALSRSENEVLAALVVTRADRQQRLMAGSGRDQVPVLHGASQWYTSVGRPTWLRSPDPQHRYGLVVADNKLNRNRLYRFDDMAGMVEIPLGVPGPVTAVAASLDGHRIALIVNGALYVAAVSFDGGVVTVGLPRRLVTPLTDLTAVDWYAENQLVFAGSEDRRPVIYQTTVDGGLGFALRREIGAPVTHLAAYPGGAVGALPTGSYMYEANRVAFRNNPHGIIERNQVLDVTPPAADAKASNPTVPFFLY
ncbi:LpqB family beta-propeller domain-containing protein [Micromonospora sp. 4G57]|uniref:LpqB family beta-propeller domain-containing protein n=1 Tax=Micromonospora sicca TaxID=2202420 RepID=A0ABU5JEE0_9ACTN|nr:MULTISPECIES: LpqB family beta-propeller domain-containing protein [unclassified Micromonospora]MDZ5445212.1 LpqB family beta-propeller domain-containing protein [Micromonospora sp. 4G57]MDZ5490911.1 LpqB family beta-propeller domain-containing protein [Micromonospora sp. 4G53]